MVQFDFFQDHHSGLYGKSSEINSFQDHCTFEQNWLISRLYELYMVKSALKIDSFQDHCVYIQNWLISRPSEALHGEKQHQIDSFQDHYIELYSALTSMEETLNRQH